MALPYQGYGYNPYQYGQVNPLQPQMDRLAADAGSVSAATADAAGKSGDPVGAGRGWS